MIEVRLQQLADSMTTAKISAWLKGEGDRVTSGEAIVEVETDKATVEIESPVSGVLQTIHVPAGTDGVAVGTLLALIGEESTLQERTKSKVEGPGSLNDVTAASVSQRDASTDVTPAVAASVPSLDEEPPRKNPQEISATPLALKMAHLTGVDLSTLKPAGGRRKITKIDVETALGREVASSSPHPATAQPTSRLASGPTVPSSAASMFRDQPLSAIRRVTAARLQEAKQNVPHFYLQTQCHADELMNLRSQMNARREDGVRLTVTDLLVFLTARALRRVPLANSAWVETGVRVYDSVDIAVAVNTNDGLITPVVRASHTKSLRVISQELSELANRARRGALRPDEYTGGTFTISNLGMFGVTAVTPIVNPPQACILGVGAIERRPVAAGDRIVVAQTMECTLSADHRAIDGATGAELLREIRRLIENPLLLAFES